MRRGCRRGGVCSQAPLASWIPICDSPLSAWGLRGTRERTKAQPALEWDSRGTCVSGLAPLSRPATWDLPRFQGCHEGQMGTCTQLQKTSVTENTASSLPNWRTE